VVKHVVTLPTLLSRTYPLDIPSFLGEYLLDGFLDLDIQKIQLVAGVLSTHWKNMKDILDAYASDIVPFVMVMIVNVRDGTK
jgi:hypothetical protein